MRWPRSFFCFRTSVCDETRAHEFIGNVCVVLLVVATPLSARPEQTGRFLKLKSQHGTNALRDKTRETFSQKPCETLSVTSAEEVFWKRSFERPSRKGSKQDFFFVPLFFSLLTACISVGMFYPGGRSQMLWYACHDGVCPQRSLSNTVEGSTTVVAWSEFEEMSLEARTSFKLSAVDDSFYRDL